MIACNATVCGGVKTANRSIQEVWTEYKRTGNITLRNRLMERYMPLVKYTAWRMHARFSAEFDIDDFISSGVFGLMSAIEGYNLSRGIKFESYCIARIRGAILDQCRSQDWVPRLVRSQNSQFAKARRSLEMVLGRPPTEEEIIQKMGVETEQFQKMRQHANTVDVISMSRNDRARPSESRLADVLADAHQANPLSTVQRREFKAFITKGLPRAERLMLILYYYEGMSMKEIGLTLNYSESRVSQMHASIMARLRAKFQNRDQELQALALVAG